MSSRSKLPYVTTVTHGLELIFEHKTRMSRRIVQDAESLLWHVSFTRGPNELHVAEFLTEAKAKSFIAAVT